MKTLLSTILILGTILFLPLPLSAQPFWTEFTYTDWSPGTEPAISALSGKEAYNSSITWDGDRFVSFFRGTDVEPYLSAYSSDGENWEYLNGGGPITVTGLFGYPMGDHTVAAAPEGFPAAESAWDDQAGNVRFKLWYANAGTAPGENFQYAESTDGINWQAFTEEDYCPPTWKTDTYRILSRPKVLYRPRGSTELSTTAPMDNRYLMYLQSGLDDEPYYYELHLSSNGLNWSLYASDWNCQSRFPGQSVETVAFSGYTAPDYLNTFEEVYYFGVRQVWMLWTSDRDEESITSWYSTDGWNWNFRESPINGIGSVNPQSGYWNETANTRLDSIRLGTSYFFLRTGENSGPGRQLGGGIKKGVLSVEIEDLPDRVWGETPVYYRLFSWNNQTCPRIDTFLFTGEVFAGEAHPGTGGDGKTNLTANIGGDRHTYIWDVNSNYATPPGPPIQFQIWPIVNDSDPPDFEKGEPQNSNSFTVEPSPTPAPEPTGTPPPSATPTPSVTPTPTVTPTPPPSATPTPSTTPTPSVTPTPEGYKTPTPTVSPTSSPTPSPTPQPTATPSLTPSATPTPSSSPTPTVTPSISPMPSPSPSPAGSGLPWIYDYDGNGTSDIGIFRPATGLWAIRGLTRTYFGSSNDDPLPGDYDGSGTTDIAIFRESSGLWAVRGVTRIYFGGSNDIPVQGDYTGDGTWVPAIFRPASGLWAIRGLTRAYFGDSSDYPVPGYYSDWEQREIAIFRESSGLWAVRGVTRVYFGGSADELVPGDYNGAGAWTPGIFRPSSGLWAIRGVTRTYFGVSSDEPIPGDYGGTLRDGITVFRESSGLWAVRGVTRVYFGTVDDLPVSR